MLSQIPVLMSKCDPALVFALNEQFLGQKNPFFQIIDEKNLKDVNFSTVKLLIYDDSAPIPDKFLPVPVKISLNKASEGDFDLVLPKPFRLGQLLTAMTQLCLHTDYPEAPVSVGPLTLHARERRLTDPETGKNSNLTDKEIKILLALADGKTMMRDTLLAQIWRYNPDVTSHTLETHIYRLRQKIEKDLGKKDVIQTIENGYALK